MEPIVQKVLKISGRQQQAWGPSEHSRLLRKGALRLRVGGLTPASGLDVYLAGTFLIRRFRAVIRISRGSMSLKVKNPVVAEGQSQKHGSESQAYGLLAAGPGPSSLTSLSYFLICEKNKTGL